MRKLDWADNNSDTWSKWAPREKNRRDNFLIDRNFCPLSAQSRYWWWTSPLSNSQNRTFWNIVYRGKLRQAKIGGSLGLIGKYYISDWPCSGSGTTYLAWEPLCPSPLIDYWMGITWFLPSHRLVLSFKSTWGRKAHSLGLWIPPGPTMLPLYFPSLTFNKPHLHPYVLLGFFHTRAQGPRSSGNIFCH
jgi:hypothetical protein